ncbi:Uncharacterised protein [Mycobacterium tuberculosis]|uniref:Uncharacterized protein n=2 Tax=Mycobacterium tuberculosis TaxID=1773 RepID=A0A655J402_MYCTX|nr:Uncharacterised protein [Mycobacterium tuberculosis]CKR48288.1 Uncharacterised protein [Mycobacterium tuberculosis]CKT07086.1 Uncharacterised protein [Mycobacterium tuberculosis]COW36866.1 Uncharacterised protein [Mycobacterium tuberculosis]COX31694.1 Uncharacterised protein [Mycobacterium tuberculosis]
MGTRCNVRHWLTPGSDRNSPSRDGTKCIAVMPSSRNRAVRYPMSVSPPGRGITIRAPQASVPKISAIETSKLGEATCSSRSVSSTSYSPLNQTKYSATGRCGTATPLGNPVVPDV